MNNETITISKKEYEELLEKANVLQYPKWEMPLKRAILNGHEILVNKMEGNWQIGTIDGIKFEAKVYEEDSEYGIDEGNVSKLQIQNQLNYDRGWDIKPKTKQAKELLKTILEFFKIKKYNYEWQTAEEVIANKNKLIDFGGWGITTLDKMLDSPTNEQYEKAHELWLKLKDAFNKEAKNYDPEIYNSKLGSVGEVERREVLRSGWWDFLDGDKYGDYGTLTFIIEMLHGDEQLETGKILFGS